MRQILPLFILILTLSGCAVTGAGRYYTPPSTNQKIFLNARINGKTFRYYIIVDGQDLITYLFPPFVNSTGTKKSIIKTIKYVLYSK